MTALTYAALAERVRSAAPRAGLTRVVAVDGPAGSVKTTLATRLGSALEAQRCAVATVHMDDLYPGWDGLAEAVPTLVEWVLEPLAAGAGAGYRPWDWEHGVRREHVEVAAADVLIVEGVGCGSRAAATYLSLLVWVEAPYALRMRRGLDLDGDSFAPHWQRWASQEAALFAAEATRERADVRVDGASQDPPENASLTILDA